PIEVNASGSTRPATLKESASNPGPYLDILMALKTPQDEAKLTRPSSSTPKTTRQVSSQKGGASIHLDTTPVPGRCVPMAGSDCQIIPPSSQMDPRVHEFEKFANLQSQLDEKAQRLVKAEAQIKRQFSQLCKTEDDIHARDEKIKACEQFLASLRSNVAEAKKTMEANNASIIKAAKDKARKDEDKITDLQRRLAIKEKNEEFLKGRLMQSEKDGKAREATMEGLIVENRDLIFENQDLNLEIEDMALEKQNMALEMEKENAMWQEDCRIQKLKSVDLEARCLDAEKAKRAAEDELRKVKQVAEGDRIVKEYLQDELSITEDETDELLTERNELQSKLKAAENEIERLKCDLATCRVGLNQAEWAMESLKYPPIEVQEEVQWEDLQEGEPQTDDEEDYYEESSESEEEEEEDEEEYEEDEEEYEDEDEEDEECGWVMP
ncbi:hypothetical protein FPOAC2_10609, partial [Fusarium poae]